MISFSTIYKELDYKVSGDGGGSGINIITVSSVRVLAQQVTDPGSIPLLHDKRGLNLHLLSPKTVPKPQGCKLF